MSVFFFFLIFLILFTLKVKIKSCMLITNLNMRSHTENNISHHIIKRKGKLYGKRSRKVQMICWNCSVHQKAFQSLSYPHEHNDGFVVLKQTAEGFRDTVSIKYQTVPDLSDAEIVWGASVLLNGARDLSRYRENGSHCVHSSNSYFRKFPPIPAGSDPPIDGDLWLYFCLRIGYNIIPGHWEHSNNKFSYLLCIFV